MKGEEDVEQIIMMWEFTMNILDHAKKKKKKF